MRTCCFYFYWPKQKSTTSSVTASVWKKQWFRKQERERWGQFDSRRTFLIGCHGLALLFLSGTKTNLWWMSLFLIILNLLIGVFAFEAFCYWHFCKCRTSGHRASDCTSWRCASLYTSTDCRAHQFINRDICGDLEVIEARRSLPPNTPLWAFTPPCTPRWYDSRGVWVVIRCLCYPHPPILSLQSLLVASEVMLQCVSSIISCCCPHPQYPV